LGHGGAVGVGTGVFGVVKFGSFKVGTWSGVFVWLRIVGIRLWLPGRGFASCPQDLLLFSVRCGGGSWIELVPCRVSCVLFVRSWGFRPVNLTYVISWLGLFGLGLGYSIDDLQPLIIRGRLFQNTTSPLAFV